ncbi:Ubiquitin carboxyl-terminal hydrolase 7 [Rhizoclosmatium sp. JEL0117]|nr:Ubiquitin carboxyl-terminal hydrolase 7 [Rhizoclosmatium sp. JEL0117]
MDSSSTQSSRETLLIQELYRRLLFLESQLIKQYEVNARLEEQVVSSQGGVTALSARVNQLETRLSETEQLLAKSHLLVDLQSSESQRRAVPLVTPIEPLRASQPVYASPSSQSPPNSSKDNITNHCLYVKAILPKHAKTHQSFDLGDFAGDSRHWHEVRMNLEDTVEGLVDTMAQILDVENERVIIWLIDKRRNGTLRPGRLCLDVRESLKQLREYQYDFGWSELRIFVEVDDTHSTLPGTLKVNEAVTLFLKIYDAKTSSFVYCGSIFVPDPDIKISEAIPIWRDIANMFSGYEVLLSKEVGPGRIDEVDVNHTFRREDLVTGDIIRIDRAPRNTAKSTESASSPSMRTSVVVEVHERSSKPMIIEKQPSTSTLSSRISTPRKRSPSPEITIKRKHTETRKMCLGYNTRGCRLTAVTCGYDHAAQGAPQMQTGPSIDSLLISKMYQQMIMLEAKVAGQDGDIANLKAEVGRLSSIANVSTTHQETQTKTFNQRNAGLENPSAGSENGKTVPDFESVNGTTESSRFQRVKQEPIDLTDLNDESVVRSRSSTPSEPSRSSDTSPNHDSSSCVSESEDDSDEEEFQRSESPPSIDTISIPSQSIIYRKRGYSPADGEPSSKRHQLQSRQICVHFAMTGECRHGDECGNRHECLFCQGYHRLGSCTTISRYGKTLCIKWNGIGSCPNRNYCGFKHECFGCNDKLHGYSECEENATGQMSIRNIEVCLNFNMIGRKCTDCTKVHVCLICESSEHHAKECPPYLAQSLTLGDSVKAVVDSPIGVSNAQALPMDVFGTMQSVADTSPTMPTALSLESLLISQIYQRMIFLEAKVATHDMDILSLKAEVGRLSNIAIPSNAQPSKQSDDSTNGNLFLDVPTGDADTQCESAQKEAQCPSHSEPGHNEIDESSQSATVTSHVEEVATSTQHEVPSTQPPPSDPPSQFLEDTSHQESHVLHTQSPSESQISLSVNPGSKQETPSIEETNSEELQQTPRFHKRIILSKILSPSPSDSTPTIHSFHPESSSVLRRKLDIVGNGTILPTWKNHTNDARNKLRKSASNLQCKGRVNMVIGVEIGTNVSSAKGTIVLLPVRDLRLKIKVSVPTGTVLARVEVETVDSSTHASNLLFNSAMGDADDPMVLQLLHERLVRLEEQYVCLSAKLESAQREKQMRVPQSEPGRLPTTVLNQTTFQIQQSPEPNQPQQNQFNRLDGLSSTHSFRLQTTSALTEQHSNTWSPVQPQHKHKYEGFHSRSEDHKSLSAVHQESRRSPSPQHHSNSHRNRSLSPRSRSPVQLPPSKYICRTAAIQLTSRISASAGMNVFDVKGAFMQPGNVQSCRK